MTNKHRKTFTVKRWHSWWAAREVNDATTQRLAAGIADMRSLLATRRLSRQRA